MAIREGRWDCGYCGTKGNLGRNRECQHCGAVREKDVRFYLPSEAEAAVLDAALLARANAGPDWYCEHCGSGNAGDLGTCRRCAAPRGSSPSHAVREHPQPPVAVSTPAASTPAGPAKGTAAPAPAKKEGSALVGCAIVAGLVAVMCFLGNAAWSSFEAWRKPKPFPATVVSRTWKHEVRTERNTPRLVTGFSWERSIRLEKRERVRDSGTDVPEGARVLRQHQEEGTRRRCETRRVRVTKQVRETKRVLSHQREEMETETYKERVGTRESSYTCGTIDMGNGFFKDKVCTKKEPVYETRTRERRKKVPVYESKTTTRDEPSYQDEKHCVDEPITETVYEYEYDEWETSREEKADAQDRSPRWPKVTPGPGERVADKHQALRVVYLDPATGLPKTLEVKEPAWRSLKVGDPVPDLPVEWWPGRTLTLPAEKEEAGGPRWPELAQNEREVERKSEYVVLLRAEDGKDYTVPVPDLETWKRYVPGGKATVLVGANRFMGAQPPEMQNNSPPAILGKD